MPLETLEFLAGRCLPEPEGPVIAPREDVVAVRGKGDGIYRVAMPLETPEFLAGRHLPETDGLVLTT